MSPRMSQGCALVLLLAMMVAMAAGMMAWGPIELSAADHAFADGRRFIGLPNALNTLACLPLGAAAFWGARVMATTSWPQPLRTPWLAFFVLAALMSASAAAYHADPSDAGYVLAQLFASGAMTMLTIAFMAERLDPWFGSATAIAAGAAVAGGAGLWWVAGDIATGHGDLRPLFYLQVLPLLLVPAGAPGLAGRFTRPTDWFFMLGMYLVARSVGLLDEAVLSATGSISGHTLMHLLLTGVVLCAAYRAAPPTRGSADTSLVDPTQRSTSLNTSS